MLVKTTGPQTRAIVAQDSCSTAWALGPGPCRPGELVDPAEPRTCSRVARDCLSTPRALGPERELPGAAVRHRGPSDTGLSHPGQLVDPTGNQSRARVLWHSWSTPWSHYWSASCPGVLVDPAGYGAGRESSGRAGLPGGHTTRALVALEGWSSTQDLGPGPESPRAAGRHRGPRDKGPSYLGQLVDPAGHRTRVGVTREGWSTPWALGPERELSGTVG